MRRLLWSAPLMFCLSACSDSASAPLCVPGESASCTGTGGCVGFQICSADGARFGACTCEPMDAGENSLDSGISDDSGLPPHDSGPMDSGSIDAGSVDSGSADSGQSADVGVSTDGGAPGDSGMWSDAGVSSSAPSAPTVSISPASPRPGDSLTCVIDVGSTDPNGDSVSYAYLWLRDWSPTSFVGNTVPSSQTSTGETWTCVVIPNDGGQVGTVGSAKVVIGLPPACAGYSMGSVSGHAVVQDSAGGSEFDLGTSWSIAFWMRFPSSDVGISTSLMINAIQNVDCGSVGFSINQAGILSGGVSNGLGPSNCGTSDLDHHVLQSVSSVAVDRWQHVALVKDEADLHLYLDGALHITDNNPNNIDAFDPLHPLTIGRHVGYVSPMAQIAFADLSFWSRALSDVEVASFSTAAGANLGETNGLIARWLLDEGTGTTAADLTGAHPIQIDPAAATWFDDSSCP